MIFLIGSLCKQASWVSGDTSKYFYKIYDTDSKRTAIINESEFNKKKSLIYNVYMYIERNRRVDYYCMYTIRIEGNLYKLDQLLHNFKSNKRSEMHDIPEYMDREKVALKYYTIVERGEDYVVGVNIRGTQKIFSISDIMTLTDAEISDMFNLPVCHVASYVFDYKEEIRIYINSLKSKGDYKFKEYREEKLNQNRIVAGSDYLVRNNGDICVREVKSNDRLDIVLNRHNYNNLVLIGDPFSIRKVQTFKVLYGPKKLKKIDSLGKDLNKVEVVLPSTLESIEPSALENASIESIDLCRCKNLRYVGSGAFKYTKLEGLKIPDSVERIGSSVVQYNTRLKWFICPKNYSTFDPSWVEGCSNLETIVLPEKKMNGWRNDRRSCFSKCSKLKEIYTSEVNVEIAHEIVQGINYIRRFMEKRKIFGSTVINYEDIKVIIVRRTD